MTIKSSRFTVLFLFALALMMMAVEVRGDYAASLPSAGCPTGYTRINNACYQLVNTLFNWTQANDSCYLEYGITYNDTLSGFAGTVTHLAAFESLAEIMSAYIWLQGCRLPLTHLVVVVVVFYLYTSRSSNSRAELLALLHRRRDLQCDH